MFLYLYFKINDNFILKIFLSFVNFFSRETFQQNFRHATVRTINAVVILSMLKLIEVNIC